MIGRITVMAVEVACERRGVGPADPRGTADCG